MNEALINLIIKQELEFFLAVQSRGYSVCQENPNAFCAARRMTHSIQTTEFLESYYQDLLEAKKLGRNIMTEKYGLMENLIQRTNYNEHLDKIIEIEKAWYQESTKRYPHITPPEGITNFQNYLCCELQTLSSRSLQLYYTNILSAQSKGLNLVLERYRNLLKRNNLPDLEEQENILAKRKYHIS